MRISTPTATDAEVITHQLVALGAADAGHARESGWCDHWGGWMGGSEKGGRDDFVGQISQ